MKVIKLSLLCFLSVLLLGACKSKTIYTTDVLVIGGSTSGTTSGISSAREGVKTMIVEETPMLGGMLTAQGVGAIDGNDALASGIWNEFRQALHKHYGGPAAVWTGWVSRTLFEPHVADSIFKSMAAELPNLDVVYGYHVVGANMSGKSIVSVSFQDNEGNEIEVKAKIVIDATDLGDALPFTNTSYRLGMDSKRRTDEALAPEEANDIVQDLTVVAILKDYGEGVDKTIPEPVGFDSSNFTLCHSNPDITPKHMLDYGKMPNGKYMINWPRYGNDIYMNVVELPYKQRNDSLVVARQKTLCFVYYIQHILGFKNLGIADDEFATPDGLAYLPYHREGRRLVGQVELTLDDVKDRYRNQLYRTGISVGDYPVDHHHNCYAGMEKIDFPPIPSFSIPMGSLIPKETENLIVSDKAISVTNLINGATRLQPVVMLTGQAAGILAATSVIDSCRPCDVSVRKIQGKLLKRGAYICPTYDVNPNDDSFYSIQRIVATGIMKLVGEPYYWSNRSWFYADTTISVAEFTDGLHNYYSQVDVCKDSTKLLTYETAINILKSLGVDNVDLPENKKLSDTILRGELAVLLDKYLKPFDCDVNLTGVLK